MAKERIDKILSHQGFGSRKDIRKILRKSEVFVNDKRIFDAGFAVDCENDTVTIDGEQISLQQNVYLMMNKVAHTISSNKDGEHQTVFDLLDDSFKTPYLQNKLHLIGRLDMDTEGLLLFTTDGELTHKIISPKNHIDKTYFVILRDEISEEKRLEIEKSFEQGIEVGPEDNDEGFKCESAVLKWPDKNEIKDFLKNSTYDDDFDGPARTENKDFDFKTHDLDKIAENLKNRTALLTIFEGKYHQVKRMFVAVENKVVYLKRISMGNLKLDENLTPGNYRELLEDELELLK